MSTKSSGSSLKLILIVAGVAMLTTVVTGLLLYTYLFPKKLRPVKLTQTETQVLEEKVSALTDQSWDLSSRAKTKKRPQAKALPQPADPKPEPYKEDPKKREITLTQREVNALVAKNTEFGERLAIHLGKDAMSAKMLLPVDPDFPFIGGKTIKAAAGVDLSYKNQKPSVILKGVSLWGVPIPNAWLGGLKNIDLVQEFGGEKGFWKSFAEGIDFVKVEDGQIHIKLKE